MSFRNLSTAQFRHRLTRPKDPHPDKTPAQFSAGNESKTMRPDKGRGLPKPPPKHPHRARAAQRQRRAR